MYKKLIIAGITLLFAACSKNDIDVNNNDVLVPVRVHVDGFSVTQEDFSGTRTRAIQDIADVSGVNAVTLAFYSGSTEVEKVTQLKSDATTYTTFGDFECSLPMGRYTMAVVAYTTKDGSPFVLTSPTEAAFTGDHVYETFTYTQAVNISNTVAVDISATLSRIVSMLTVKSSDGKTANVSNVRMTFFAGGKNFSPTTGLAINNTGFANTVGNSASIGATSTSSTCLFLATDEQDIDVTIETLDADGAVLFSKTVENVPFKRNRKTILIGAMYTNEALSGTFQVETAWLTDQNGSF